MDRAARERDSGRCEESPVFLGLRLFQSCDEVRVVGDTPGYVFVVDGDREVATLFQRAAKELQLEVAHFSSAEDAWERLLVRHPLAVFTDYRLPGFDGLSLLELVGHYVPTAKRILHTAERVVSPVMGLDIPVLGKPCDEASLTELLRSLEPRAENALRLAEA
jgi:DNA-binding NtrC family response regulator